MVAVGVSSGVSVQVVVLMVLTCFGVSSFLYLMCCSPDQCWRRIFLALACERFFSACCTVIVLYIAFKFTNL